MNEVKLIVAGFEDVGKTSLVNRLAYDNFAAVKDPGRTEIIELLLNCVAGQVLARIWDFGEEEIIHGMNKCLLTPHSLYLLVLNARRGDEDADVEFWMNLIERYGEDSPVIVVLNKIEQHPCELDFLTLRRRYPAIRSFVKTDCKTGTGIDELRRAVICEVDQLNNARFPCSHNWTGVKGRLSKLTDNFISFERFRDICRKCGESDAREQDLLAIRLHNLGIALNYNDDLRLRETCVLRPNWIIEGLSRLLNAPPNSHQAGELRLSQVGNLLPESSYPREKHLFLIELMRKFELCFPFDGAGERYFVPALLGKQEPETLIDDFPPDACLNFEYHYTPDLPECLLPRFIVRTCAHGDPDRRWRTGAVLKFEECSAMVEADPQGHRIIVRINGPVKKRRFLLSAILQNFESIHYDLNKIIATAKVPIPGYADVLVDYEELRLYEKERRKKKTVRIGKNLQDYNVSALLEGINVPVHNPVQRVEEVAIKQPALRLFCSYSHTDEQLRKEFETHLTPLQGGGLIEPWHDRKILPGDEWDGQISHHLEQADIILLLVSADFIASKYCREIEIKRAMERHDVGAARVIPIFLRKCSWKTTPFAKLQGLPRDMGIVDGDRRHRDAAWTEVAEELRNTISELQRSRGTRS